MLCFIDKNGIKFGSLSIILDKPGGLISPKTAKGVQKYARLPSFFRAVFSGNFSGSAIVVQNNPQFLTIRAHPAIIYCGFLVAPWWLSMAPAAIDVRRPGCPRLEPGTVRPSMGISTILQGKRTTAPPVANPWHPCPNACECVRLGSLACHHACRLICSHPRELSFFLQSWGCAPIGGVNTPIG